jgi:glycosyltransferase involved in cell wall biosynthesis
VRLKRAIGKLPNVRLRDGAKDMRLIYRETKVLLVPSQWEAETWGRVASEAHFSGIPVVASNRGGLPEAVGPGGIILGYDEHASKWAEAIRKLWYDDSLYKQLSAGAVRYAARPLLDPVALTRSLVSALENATQSAN